MGCWNETCLLTRLPIQCGDKTVAIIIAPTNKTSDPCLAEDLFIPAALPIFGEYNDYGGLENLEDPYGTLSLLRDIELCASQTSGDRLEITERDDRKYAETLITNVREDKAYLHAPVYSGMARADYRHLYVVFMLRDFYDFAIQSKRNLPDRLNGDMLSVGYGIDCLSLLKPRHAKTLKQSELQSKAAADLLKLNAFMNSCRINWTPTCGSGSQNDLGDRYQLQFYQMMAERAQDIHLTNRDYNENEDD